MVAEPTHHVKPLLFAKKREELSLSNVDLEKLMRGVLDKGASFRFQGKGYSMSPFIKDGDVLTIIPLQKSCPCFGDVVVFTHPHTGKIIIHRIIGKNADFYRTKGDNASQEDGTISREAIMGQVTNVERNGKYVSVGLGLERSIIAFVTRNGLLPFLNPFWCFVRLFVKRPPRE